MTQTKTDIFRWHFYYASFKKLDSGLFFSILKLITPTSLQKLNFETHNSNMFEKINFETYDSNIFAKINFETYDTNIFAKI